MTGRRDWRQILDLLDRRRRRPGRGARRGHPASRRQAREHAGREERLRQARRLRPRQALADADAEAATRAATVPPVARSWHVAYMSPEQASGQPARRAQRRVLVRRGAVRAFGGPSRSRGRTTSRSCRRFSTGSRGRSTDDSPEPLRRSSRRRSRRIRPIATSRCATSSSTLRRVLRRSSGDSRPSVSPAPPPVPSARPRGARTAALVVVVARRRHRSLAAPSGHAPRPIRAAPAAAAHANDSCTREPTHRDSAVRESGAPIRTTRSFTDSLHQEILTTLAHVAPELQSSCARR